MDLVAAVGGSPVPLGPEVPLIVRHRHLTKVGEASWTIWSGQSLVKDLKYISSYL